MTEPPDFADSAPRRRFDRIADVHCDRVANLAQFLRGALLGIGDGAAWRGGVLADPCDPEAGLPVDRPFVEDVDLVPLAAARDQGFLASRMGRAVIGGWPILTEGVFRFDRGFGSAPVYLTSPACRIPFEADPWWIAMTALTLAQVRAIPERLLETAYDGTSVEAQIERADKLLWTLANVVAVRGLGPFLFAAAAWASSPDGMEALTAATPARRELMERRFAEGASALAFFGKGERESAVAALRRELCPWSASGARAEKPVTSRGLSRRAFISLVRVGRRRTT